MGAPKGRIPWNKGKKRRCPWMKERNEKYRTFKDKFEIYCLNCQKIFKVSPSRKDTSKFCCKKCKNEFLIKTKISLYRKIAFINLPKFCAKCFSNKSLIVHHLDKNRRNNQLNNLIILCRSCHYKIHQER